MKTLMLVLPLVMIGIVAAILVTEHKYEDGIVGRAALGLTVVLAIVMVFGEVLEGRYSTYSELTALLWALAIFMARHYYRFLLHTRIGVYLWRFPSGDVEDEGGKWHTQ